MSPKRLNSYKGRLDHRQIADGMNVANRNAHRLFEDAQILLDAERYASAASLAILSIEESGKNHILRMIALATTDEELFKLWREYRTHTKKNILWLMPRLVAEGARQLDDFKALFQSDAEHPYILDHIKQIGFYTDCLGEAHWSEPNDVIDKELARMLVQTARLFLSDKEIQAKEIELWVKHMGKVKDSDLRAQKDALSNWYAEMQEVGLGFKGQKITDFMRWLGMDVDI